MEKAICKNVIFLIYCLLNGQYGMNDMPKNGRKSSPKQRKGGKARVVKSASKRYEPMMITRKIEEAAKDYMVELLGAGNKVNIRPKELAESLATHAIQASKASRRQQLDAVAKAYAAFVMTQSGSEYYFVLEDIAKEIGCSIRKNTDPLRVWLQAVISYGEDTPGDARRLYSRDVNAIRYLISQEVGPKKLADHAKKPGAGLDTWAREWSKLKREGVKTEEPRDRPEDPVPSLEDGSDYVAVHIYPDASKKDDGMEFRIPKRKINLDSVIRKLKKASSEMGNTGKQGKKKFRFRSRSKS